MGVGAGLGPLSEHPAARVMLEVCVCITGAVDQADRMVVRVPVQLQMRLQAQGSGTWAADPGEAVAGNTGRSQASYCEVLSFAGFPWVTLRAGGERREASACLLTATPRTFSRLHKYQTSAERK